MGYELENREAEELKAHKPYVTWETGGTEYRLKLTTNAIVKLESKYGKNLLLYITEEGLPPVRVMLEVIQAAMEKYEHGMTFSKVADLYDDYIENDHNVTDLMADVIMPLLANAGFFTKEEAEELKKELTM